MLGAIIGDIVGSRFEFANHRSRDFDLFSPACFFTDDTVMTLAAASALMRWRQAHGRDDWDALSVLSAQEMRRVGRPYPGCGYGGRFYDWMYSDTMGPYNSFGNGAAMRVSPVGWVARNENEVKRLSHAVTAVTHNHPEGLKGAEVTAQCIFLARTGHSLAAIRERVQQDYYALDFTIDAIRPHYQFNETCQDTVPQAIQAFLESTSFEDAIRLAISVGGDSDTLAAITGSIAQAYYGVPEHMEKEALRYLDAPLKALYKDWQAFLR